MNEKIKEKAEFYQETIENIERKRTAWSEKVKERIYNKLEEVRGYASLSWNIQKIEHYQNNQAINIGFGPIPSGITSKTEKGFKSFMKKGGRLVFTQSYNGNIYIVITYPCVEEIVTQKPDELIDEFDPEQLTNEVIEEQVIRFLDKMIEWENHASRERQMIGFKAQNDLSLV